MRETRSDRAASHDARLPAPVLEGPATLRAGERRWIRWRPPGPEVEELELLLSVDDGRRFALRASPELPGAEDRYEWRVPNLPAARARLRLRMRIGGREVESDAGPAFTIEADLARPIERELVHDGSWWILPERTAGAAPAAFAEPGSSPGLGAARPTAMGEAPPRSPLAGYPGLGQGPRPAANGPVHRTAPRPRTFQPPRRTPLRA